MEVEFLKKHGFQKKGDITLLTNDFAKELIKKNIVKPTGKNDFIEKETKMIEENQEDL